MRKHINRSPDNSNRTFWKESTNRRVYSTFHPCYVGISYIIEKTSIKSTPRVLPPKLLVLLYELPKQFSALPAPEVHHSHPVRSEELFRPPVV